MVREARTAGQSRRAQPTTPVELPRASMSDRHRGGGTARGTTGAVVTPVHDGWGVHRSTAHRISPMLVAALFASEIERDESTATTSHGEAGARRRS